MVTEFGVPLDDVLLRWTVTQIYKLFDSRARRLEERDRPKKATTGDLKRFLR